MIITPPEFVGGLTTVPVAVALHTKDSNLSYVSGHRHLPARHTLLDTAGQSLSTEHCCNIEDSTN